jgi:hypothetical protein
VVSPVDLGEEVAEPAYRASALINPPRKVTAAAIANRLPQRSNIDLRIFRNCQLVVVSLCVMEFECTDTTSSVESDLTLD